MLRSGRLFGCREMPFVLIFILPHLVAAPVFGVFLAEPVSDILAATITTITFFARFDRILEKGAARV